MDASPSIHRAHAVLGVLGRTSAVSLRAIARHRGLVFAAITRAVFWGALVLWCVTAMALVSGGALDTDGALARFVFGAAACATVTVAASSARVRWLTALVGALHGVAGLTLWLLV